MMKNSPTIDEVTEESVRVIHLYNSPFLSSKVELFWVMQLIFFIDLEKRV